ncbi:MAG: hypothetical protein GY817_01385 [bacterium]|nr:hypothetical protein [bacterium]
MPYQIINSEVGEKYYKNGWSKSRGRELGEAIIADKVSYPKIEEEQ